MIDGYNTAQKAWQILPIIGINTVKKVFPEDTENIYKVQTWRNAEGTLLGREEGEVMTYLHTVLVMSIY